MMHILSFLLCQRATGFVVPHHQTIQHASTRLHFAPPTASSSLVAAALSAPPPLPTDPSSLLVAASEVATEAAEKGWFDNIVVLVEHGITGVHNLLGDGSYGVSIIVFTLIIKSLTFPLNYAQIESTTRMQQLQPAIKKIQAKYSNDPQQMNLMMAQLYEENSLNPLAGCLPALVQIPIFIALYRALLNLAKQDLLEESFLWLPNLEGPVFGATNADWLFKFDDWRNGAPPLGWHDSLAYLSLPLILVIAQSISSKLLQPPVDPNNESAATSNAVLKFLPLMIGFFSLNVPSSLCIYWIVNNVFTTASTVLIRKNVNANGPVTMGGAAINAGPATKSAPPPPSRSEPKSFEDMIAKTIDVTPVKETSSTMQSVSPSSSASATPKEAPAAAASSSAEEKHDGGEQPAEISKTAAKKLRKATKSRRSKKSRR